MKLHSRELMAQNCLQITQVLNRSPIGDRGPLDWLELGRLFAEKAELMQGSYYNDTEGARLYLKKADECLVTAMKQIGI